MTSRLKIARSRSKATFQTASRGALLIFAAALWAQLALAGSPGAEDSTEDQDRTVDQAALTAQDEAVSELSAMLEKYRGTPQEPVFLEKLAEIDQQSAAMEFRVVHGDAHRLGKGIDLSRYHRIMERSIPPLSRLIAKYPGHADIAHVYFMRGKAYEEIGDVARSRQDYLLLVERFPAAPETIPAYMSLGEFAVTAKQPRQAVGYFSRVEKNPSDSHYPIALHKMAWAYYDLREIPAALSTAERLVDFHRGRRLSGSERGMLDNILHDVPLFFFAGYEQGRPECSTEKALPYFRKVDDGENLGRMIKSYGTLLRSYDHEKDLIGWKDLVLSEEPRRHESYEVLLTTYEYQMTRMRWAEVARSADDIARLYKRFADDAGEARRAQKLLLDTSAEIQKSMLVSRDPARNEAYGQWLAAVYDAFVRIAGEDDSRVRTIRGNLAETLFAIGEYDKATDNYRWVVDHSRRFEADASLKAIGSRYESLRRKRLVPGELKAVALPSRESSPAPEPIREWVDWIDSHVKHTGNPIDNFQFEANRCLYAQGEIRLAMERMRQFALRFPGSSYAIPAATLVADTYIASAQWAPLYEISNQFLEVKAWNGTKFHQRMYTLAADSKLKMAQAYASQRDYGNAIRQSDELIQRYGRSEHLIDALTVAESSAVGMKDRSLAILYLSRIAAAAPKTRTAANALLAKAKIEEERYSFEDAANTYLAYLALPRSAAHPSAESAEEMRRRVATYAWLSGDGPFLRRMLADRSICGRHLRAQCERYEALQYLSGSKVDSRLARAAARNADRARPGARAIWAAIALEDAAELGFGLRHRMVRSLSRHWRDLDELTKFSLVPRISASVPGVFALDRASIERSGRPGARERSLTRRLRLVGQMEESAVDAAKLPWSRIRVLVLNEMASAYSDLASGVRGLPAPRRLRGRALTAYRRMIGRNAAPLEQKSFALRSEAFRLVSQTAVEPEVYDLVARAMFAGQKAGAPKQREIADLDLNLVRSVDERGSWRSVNLDSAEPSQVLRARWAAALQARNWPLVGYFAQEARQKSLLPDDAIGVAKAVSLAMAGARAEGNMELADLCRGRRDGRMKSACSAMPAAL